MAMSPRLLRPRATGFDPRSIATLSYWLDASDSASVTTVSGAVSSWASKVGAGTATQGAANNRPAYTTAGRNGRNVITFDGSNDFLTTSTLSLNQPFTIFWAGRSNGTGNVGPYVCDGSTSTTRVAVLWNGDGTAGTAGRLGSFAGTAVIQAGSGTQAYNAWAVVAATFSGASSVLRADGAQIATGNVGANNITALSLGDRFSSLPLSGTPFNGPWGEFLIYTGSITTAQIQRIERYLANKWSVTLA